MKSTFYQKYATFIISASLIIASALMQNNASADSNIVDDRSITAGNTTPPQAPIIAPNDKNNNQGNTIVNEKRELSSFFKIGIGINFVMLMVFAYWAIGQWRQNKK